MSKVSKSTKPANNVLPSEDDWIDLENERFMWAAKPGRVLQGYLLATEHLTPKNGRPFEALVIRTTAETAQTDRDGEEILAPPGTDVLVPVTARLRNFVKLSEQPHDVYEVRITAIKEVDLGAGQRMWTYRVQSKPMPIPRTTFGPMFAVYTEPPMLAEANGAESFPAE